MTLYTVICTNHEIKHANCTSKSRRQLTKQTTENKAMKYKKKKSNCTTNCEICRENFSFSMEKNLFLFLLFFCGQMLGKKSLQNVMSFENEDEFQFQNINYGWRK